MALGLFCYVLHKYIYCAHEKRMVWRVSQTFQKPGRLGYWLGEGGWGTGLGDPRTGPGGMYELGEDRDLVGEPVCAQWSWGVARRGVFTVCVWGGEGVYVWCVCGMYVCDVYNVRVVCVCAYMCVLCVVRAHPHVCGVSLRLYVVVHFLHFLFSFSLSHIHTDEWFSCSVCTHEQACLMEDSPHIP